MSLPWHEAFVCCATSRAGLFYFMHLVLACSFFTFQHVSFGRHTHAAWCACQEDFLETDVLFLCLMIQLTSLFHNNPLANLKLHLGEFSCKSYSHNCMLDTVLLQHSHLADILSHFHRRQGRCCCQLCGRRRGKKLAATFVDILWPSRENAADASNP